MPAEIRRLTVSQFTALLESCAPALVREIAAVHLHHTWRPTRSQFKGQATIEAIRNYHVKTNHWSDIAQHLTIDPQGFLWTGRNWNSPPASQVGRNGTATRGPFMIELVGDFDTGRDVLDGEQRTSAVAVIARLIRTFSLGTTDIYFHRELNSPKSCPGNGVDKAQLLAEIDALARSIAPAAQATARGGVKAAAPFSPRHWLGHEVTLPVEAPEPGFERFEIQEHQFAADSIREQTRTRILAASDRNVGSVTARASQWDALRPHVINLTRGRLSQGGQFEMPDGSIEAIIDSIARYAAATDQPKLMLHAHGGLVSETQALKYAQSAHGWWLDHGIYPLYFIWETGLLEILKQRLGLARGVIGDVRDFIFEATARTAGGKVVWSDMKESARRASSENAGDGEAGGARIFATALAPLIKAVTSGNGLSVHAVGHSAGAIFHAHLLPLLLDLDVTIKSLSLLAPAIRVDLFKQMLLKPIAEQRIEQFAMFTMNEEAERDDDCVEPLGLTLYGKSLLYLVSRGFEPKRKTPILGLEEMLKEDAELVQLFKTAARLELAQARGKPPNQATQARRHGSFDNDPATMASVLKTIAQLTPGTPFPDDGTEGRNTEARQFTFPLAPALLPNATHGRALVATGTRRALCVGIDGYQDRPLAGCVGDAKAWAGVLTELGFGVTTLLDSAATRQAVLAALQGLVESARAGDVLVFQYSGHGTQVEDLNDDESDRYDEALVPVDYHTGALLLDDDLADIYRRIPEGVALTLFMDCCHSGTNSRFAPLDRSQIPGGERRRFLELPDQVKDAHRRFRSRYGSPAPTSAEESLPGVIHFAACLDNQFAYESNGQGHFTKIATASLADFVRRAATNESFAMDVAGKVAAMLRPQTPKLMRLPAPLCEQRLLCTAAGSAPTALPTIAPNADQGWDHWCLQFFESAAAQWRQRLGR